jgi:hypothetical protein
MLVNHVLMLLMAFSLTACASQYGRLTSPSKYASGYQEKLLTEELLDDKTTKNGPNKYKHTRPVRYSLTYQGTTSDTSERITAFWHQRANELCTEGYNVESHYQSIVYDTIRSPVNGRMENLGTQQPIERGVIQCFSKMTKAE